ncbi:MAG TPA: hypothetical protein DCS93_39355 [Microscillaceae bacterium]|nr:hypothetical protein [Microscillaceae bacterium]
MKSIFQNKLASIVIACLSLTMYLSGCTKAIIEEPAPNALPALTQTIRYNPEVQNIMFNHCTTCHGGNNPSAGLDLTTYQNVRQSTELGTLNQRINDAANPMPQSGLLPPSERQIIAKWIQDGFPEN